MILNVLYDNTTGAVKRWSNRPLTPTSGEGVIEVQNRNLLGAQWTVDLTTKALTQVIQGPSWGKIRMIRDALLAQTDFVNNADYPMAQEKRAAVRAYRQALRDIPTAYATPEAVVWPVNPM
jgi:hypothetical protein